MKPCSRFSRPRRQTSSGRRVRRGNATVEFAVVAPIMILMVFGIIEFGRVMLAQQVLTNSSRVGARLASMPNQTSATVTQAAQEYADGASVPGVTVTITPDPTSALAGDLVTVNVSVPFNDVSWLPSPFFMGGQVLEGESVMRKEGFE